MSIFREHKTSADRSASDRARHKKKIEKAIREGITDIIAEESIIGHDGNKKIKIPVRGIKEWQFVYGDNEGQKQVGSAPGTDITQGQVIKEASPEDGTGNKASKDKGEEMYEVEITLDELAEYLFDSLKLPDLDKKKLKSMISDRMKKHGIKTKGIRPRLDKKRSAIERLRRKAATTLNAIKDENLLTEEVDKEIDTAEDESFPFHDNDLRYSNIKTKKKEATNAVIFFMMDVSGSMTKDIKFIARSYFFLLYHFIRYKYDKADLVFIAHTTEAWVTDEDKFFKRSESGGTFISSAASLALDIIEKQYHPSAWNIYAFHCTDGDNWPEDNFSAITNLCNLSDISQMMVYTEIVPDDVDKPKWQKSDDDNTLWKIMFPLNNDKFKMFKLTSSKDIWPTFTKLFGGLQ